MNKKLIWAISSSINLNRVFNIAMATVISDSTNNMNEVEKIWLSHEIKGIIQETE